MGCNCLFSVEISWLINIDSRSSIQHFFICFCVRHHAAKINIYICVCLLRGEPSPWMYFFTCPDIIQPGQGFQKVLPLNMGIETQSHRHWSKWQDLCSANEDDGQRVRFCHICIHIRPYIHILMAPWLFLFRTKNWRFQKTGGFFLHIFDLQRSRVHMADDRGWTSQNDDVCSPQWWTGWARVFAWNRKLGWFCFWWSIYSWFE